MKCLSHCFFYVHLQYNLPMLNDDDDCSYLWRLWKLIETRANEWLRLNRVYMMWWVLFVCINLLFLISNIFKNLTVVKLNDNHIDLIMCCQHLMIMTFEKSEKYIPYIVDYDDDGRDFCQPTNDLIIDSFALNLLTF